MNKYRLVIFGDFWDVCQVAHRDWIVNPLVTYISNFRPKGLLGFLQRIQFNPKLNSILNIPFKDKWNPYYLRGVNVENACFLVTERWLRMECGIRLLPYLRNNYPNSCLVCFTQDLVETIKDFYSHRPVDVNYVKKYSDLFISFDFIDSRKHKLAYHPTVFSPLCLPEFKVVNDLYFLGRDKGRLKTLVNICSEARRRGLRVLFLLIEVPKEQRIKCDGITYLDRLVPYEENLRNVASSRCVIEMFQSDATSPTFRTWECIMLNKMLVTNSTSIRHSEFYDSRYVSVFSDENDIDWGAVDRGCAFVGQQNPMAAKIRPQSLVTFIEKKLQIQIAT